MTFILDFLNPLIDAVQLLLDTLVPAARHHGVTARYLGGLVVPIVALIPAIMIARGLERIRPIENHDSAEAQQAIVTEWKLIAAMSVLGLFSQVLMFVVLGRVVQAMGGALVAPRPTSTLGIVGMVVVYALYIDCSKYWFHRISHMVPFLWKIHSFHHSAERITFATGARHHWAETFFTMPLNLAVVFVFHVPDQVASLSLLLLRLPDAMQHLNYKIAWHRVGVLFNTPHWHRIHHSLEPKHYDKNFSSSLPIMDILFGTAYYPAPDEYPDTGLAPRDSPDVWEGVVWPFRGSK